MDVLVARIYITEGTNNLHELLNYLHDSAKVRGVTVFRAISGFGKSGKMHEVGLFDLNFDLPVVLEFFDKPDKVQETIKYINSVIEPGHIITWHALMSEK